MKIDSGANELCEKLVAHYAEPGRAYHNLQHVEACLALLDEVDADDPDALEMAIWFHDVIYDPKAKDNELRSAELARAELKKRGCDGGFIQKVYDLIMATCHGEAAADGDAALMVDIDLAILGADPDVFDAYDAAIRQEYAHVREADYRRGRRAVLAMFLKRSRIFETDDFHERFEQQARENLARRVAELTD